MRFLSLTRFFRLESIFRLQILHDRRRKVRLVLGVVRDKKYPLCRVWEDWHEMRREFRVTSLDEKVLGEKRRNSSFLGNKRSAKHLVKFPRSGAVFERYISIYSKTLSCTANWWGKRCSLAHSAIFLFCFRIFSYANFVFHCISSMNDDTEGLSEESVWIWIIFRLMP